MRFEWDETKRRTNVEKHGLDFIDVAALSSSGPFAAIAFTSSRQGAQGMKKRARIVRYTAEQLEEMRRRGESLTVWAKVDAMSDADLERGMKDVPDEDIEWGDWEPGIPAPKRHLNLRLDADVVDWFKRQGRGYQTRMNAVLRAYVRAQEQRSRE